MAESAKYFSATPWCQELLSDPDFVIVHPDSRLPKVTTEDSFFAETLSTDRTVSNVVGIYRKPEKDEDLTIDDARYILELQQGVNGFPNIAHGGFVATLLDEVLGFLIGLNGTRRKERGIEVNMNFFTAYLNVKYLAPLGTPSIVMATAGHVKVEKNKQFLYATIEDGHGKQYATADALFISPKAKI